MKPTTRSQQKRARELLQQINLLCTELDDLLLRSVSEDSDDNLIGKRVHIIHGKHKGKNGVVTRPRGHLYYYITLDDGTEVFKMPANFHVVPRF